MQLRFNAKKSRVGLRICLWKVIYIWQKKKSEYSDNILQNLHTRSNVLLRLSHLHGLSSRSCVRTVFTVNVSLGLWCQTHSPVSVSGGMETLRFKLFYINAFWHPFEASKWQMLNTFWCIADFPIVPYWLFFCINFFANICVCMFVFLFSMKWHEKSILRSVIDFCHSPWCLQFIAHN